MQYLRSKHWQRTRIAAIERASFQCERCDSAIGLNVHHKTYERLGAELAEDLEVLCGDCHRTHHWGDHEYRERQSNGRKVSWENPERKKKASAQSKERWADPAYREKQSASRKASWNEERREKARQASAGESNRFYGKTHSRETRELLSQAQQKAWLDPEYREKLTAARRGRAVSTEHRAKISAALKGRVKSPEERVNISAGLRGRKYSDETRAKLAAKQKGRKLPDEVKAKIGAASRGSGNPSAKLTEEDVRGIRRLIGTQTLVSIARQFRVSVHAIRRIRDGKAWTHVR